MVHVYKEINRVDSHIVEAFKNLGTATIYEAAGRKGALNPNIKPLGKGIKLSGPAFTVQCHPKDNLMLHKALQIAKEGDIIVAVTDNYPYAGYWGDLMTTSAVTRKLGGLVIDGSVRDSEQIVGMRFPVFCRGTCIKGTTKLGLGFINHSILIGGIIVQPGDLIVGDDDGIVVVPQGKITEIMNASLARIEKEKEKRAKLKKGITSVELNNLEGIFKQLGMVEE